MARLVGPDTPIGFTVGDPSNAGMKQYLLADLVAMGVYWLRWQPYWSSIELTAGNYTWTGVDSAVAACNAKGINILLTISRPPPFVLLPNGAPDPNKTLALAKAMCQRYDGKHGQGIMQGIDLGNEDYAMLDDPTDLAITMNTCYPFLKSTYPDLSVGPGCNLHRRTSLTTTFWTTMWSKAAGNFDYMNIHYYTCNSGSTDPSDDTFADVPSYPHALQILRTAASNAGFPNFPIWNTETGFPMNSNGGYATRCIDATGNSMRDYLNYEFTQIKNLGQPAKVFIYTLGYGNTPPTTGQGNSQGESLYQGIPGQGGFATPAYAMVQNFPKNWGGGSTTHTVAKDATMRARMTSGTATISDLAARARLSTIGGGTLARKDLACRSSISGGSFDTFIRSNQPQWGIATDGESWVQANGTATASIVSNHGQVTGASGNNTFRLGTQALADAEASVRVSVTTVGAIAGITLRDTSLTDFVRLRFNASQLQLTQQTAAGGFVILATSGYIPLASTNYRVKFRAQGATLWGKIWQDTATEPPGWLISATTTVTTAGQYGLACAPALSTDLVLFDQFAVVVAATNSGPGVGVSANIAMRARLSTRSTFQMRDIACRANLIESGIGQIVVTVYAAKRPPLQRRFPKS